MSEPIIDRRQSAAALAYRTGDAAPRLVAKGQGLVAQQIIERARAAGVFVHESPELVTLLLQVDLDSRIPPALYRAIAELLAWLYHVDAARNTGTQLSPPPASLMAAHQNHWNHQKHESTTANADASDNNHRTGAMA